MSAANLPVRVGGLEMVRVEHPPSGSPLMLYADELAAWLDQEVFKNPNPGRWFIATGVVERLLQLGDGSYTSAEWEEGRIKAQRGFVMMSSRDVVEAILSRCRFQMGTALKEMHLQGVSEGYRQFMEQFRNAYMGYIQDQRRYDLRRDARAVVCELLSLTYFFEQVQEDLPTILVNPKKRPAYLAACLEVRRKVYHCMKTLEFILQEHRTDVEHGEVSFQERYDDVLSLLAAYSSLLKPYATVSVLEEVLSDDVSEPAQARVRSRVHARIGEYDAVVESFRLMLRGKDERKSQQLSLSFCSADYRLRYCQGSPQDKQVLWYQANAAWHAASSYANSPERQAIEWFLSQEQALPVSEVEIAEGLIRKLRGLVECVVIADNSQDHRERPGISDDAVEPRGRTGSA